MERYINGSKEALSDREGLILCSKDLNLAISPLFRVPMDNMHLTARRNLRKARIGKKFRLHK